MAMATHVIEWGFASYGALEATRHGLGFILRGRRRARLACPVAGCTLTRGHRQPCWDGAPDPRLVERL